MIQTLVGLAFVVAQAVAPNSLGDGATVVPRGGIVESSRMQSAAPKVEIDPAPQERAAAQDVSPDTEDPVSVVDDVVVWGSMDAQARDFVEEIEAAPGGRGIGRWDQALCIGVVNFKGDFADALLAHLAVVAGELGLEVGQPGCEPTAVIVGVSGGKALASTLVDQRRQAFRLSASGTGRGSAALVAFAESDAPVRWWHVSFRFDANTGRIVDRLPGERAYMGPPPGGGFLSTSRRATTDRIRRAVVVADVDRIGGVTFEQFADYLALVTFAQVDPSSDMSAHRTILNLFGNGQDVDGLTEWDRAYLHELYSAGPWRRNQLDQAEGLADTITAQGSDGVSEVSPTPP